MAIWQYTFQLIPSGIIEKKIELDDDGLYETGFFWKIKEKRIEVFNEIGDILPKSLSWTDNLIIYGDLESNCLEVYKDTNYNDYVDSASFRIDFRSNYIEILSRIISLSELNRLSILDEALNIVPLKLEIIIDIIDNSPQKRKYLMLLGGNLSD